MTLPSDRTYFPSLEQCLTGETALLSWKHVACALSDSSSRDLTTPAVSKFLKDPYVHQLLKSPAKAFEAPSARSKADFETKTAAINVTPTPSDTYDIKAIKEDAQWLSQNAKVNEVAALRVVVVAFYNLARDHLVGPFSTQDVVNFQEATGVSNAQASSILGPLNLSAADDPERIWAKFDTVEARRQRLLATYLSERRSLMMTADYLMTFLLHSQNNTPDRETSLLRRSILMDAFGFDEQKDANIAVFEIVIPAYFSLLSDILEHSQTVLQTVDPKILTPELEVNWVRTSLTETLHAMTFCFQILDLASQIFADRGIVEQWFKFVDSVNFLERLDFADDALSELILPLRSMVCVISLSLINPNRSMAYLDQDLDLQEHENPYLESPELLSRIHELITDASKANIVTASPVIFAWSVILYRMYVAYQERSERRDLLQNQQAQDGFELENQRSSTGRRSSVGSIVSMEKSAYDVFLSTSSLERDVQVVERLAKGVTSQGLVFELIHDMALCLGSHEQAAFRPLVGSRARLVFLDFLKTTFPIVGYLSEPLSALLAVLSGGQQYWDLQTKRSIPPEQEVPAQALQDPLFLNLYVVQALNRYPYEFIPFTNLCRILSTSLCVDDRSDVLLNFLLKTPSLTVEFDQRWDKYELAQEVDNSNTIRLIDDVLLFAPTTSRKGRVPEDDPFRIPAGTFGRFVTDHGKIVLLEYEHSTLALLGKRLEVSTTSDGYVAEPLGFLQREEIAEAISFLATLIRATVLRTATTASERPSEAGLNILLELSKALPRTRDSISVICDILDNAIQSCMNDSSGADIAVMSSCLQFLHAVLPLLPGRVLSYMARCELLSAESRLGRLSGIAGNNDTMSERFQLLVSAINLYCSLIKSAMHSVVQRKAGMISSNRQKLEEDPWLGTSDKILARVCLSIVQATVDIYENSTTWRFDSELQRSTLVGQTVRLMNDTVTFSFSIGDSRTMNGLTACLAPAARYTTDHFLSSSTEALTFQPLITSFVVASQVTETTLYPQREQIINQRLVVVLKFVTNLLRIANSENHPQSPLQTRLFKISSLIARVYSLRDAFRLPSLALLEALVESAGKADSEPSSLLGYFGPQISRSFILMVSKLDKPLDRLPVTSGIWKFFSTILRNRQQWMANCLLTGKTPREALQGDGHISKLSSGSILHVALEKLASISTLPSQETLAVLDFFTSAQNFWPWTVFAMQEQNSFLDVLRKFVHDLKSPSVMSKAAPAEAAYQAKIAAYIAETFAMQLYHLRQLGRAETFATDVVNDLDYFLRDGVQVSGYNASLHGNFAQNFAKRYVGCSVEDFKTTSLAPRHLGPQYYYVLDMAEAMLGFDIGWIGPRRNGFRYEMETANLNLSLVDAEISLFHAWEYLLLELSLCLPRSQKIAKQMLQVAEKCLESNQNTQTPEEIFTRISQSRANLSLTLLQRLADRSMLPKDISQLLVTVSSTLYGVENPFSSGQVEYYRTLLKILFVVLRGANHSSNVESVQQKPANGGISVNTTQQVLDLLNRVVFHGFRTLGTLAHEADASTTPEDVALMTAILQACLSIPGVDQCQTEILNILMSSDVAHVATSLFSWAERLSGPEPVYGELSLLFLLALSTLPTVAEQLACDGLLAHLSAAGITNLMRRPAVGPLAENSGAARCYGIWARGLLPLLLNLLGALGATIAPEVAFVLGQFPNLLRASTERFEAPGLSRTADRDAPRHVTLLAVSEIHSLALLTRVLAALRVEGAGAGVGTIPAVPWDDGGVLLENVEFWLTSRKLLRESLVPLGAREADWRASKPVRGANSGCENRLEEKVVAQLEAVRDVLSDGLED